MLSVPVESSLLPMTRLNVRLTVPPSETVSVPAPLLPTCKMPSTVQTEPVPSTVAVPVVELAHPRWAVPEEVSVPPAEISSVPVPPPSDRKGVVQGKGVSVRVDLGVCRLLKKKQTRQK